MYFLRYGRDQHQANPPYKALCLCLLSVVGLAGCSPYTQTPTQRPPSAVLSPQIASPDFRPGQPQTVDRAQQEASSPKHRPSTSQGNAIHKRNQTVSAIYQQALRAFHQHYWDQSIRLSERGLRIHRQYAPFYWLLAESYRAKGNAQQAQAFARQGLNYTDTTSAIYQQLIRLADTN